jgi:hypothetical protein
MRGAVAALSVVFLAGILAASTVGAQVLPRPAVAPPLPPQGTADSLNRGPKAVPAIGPQWLPLDSVGLALLKRQGMTAVRYQAETIEYDATKGVMTLIGKTGARAIVEREQTSLVSDTIEFASKVDSLQARGDTIRLHEPTRKDDLLMQGFLRYDLRTRSGLASEVSTAAQVGEIWNVEAHRAGFVAGDSATGEASKFYGKGGIFTSCTDSVRHFHFAAGEIKRITNDVVVARNVVLHVMGVPVLWLPFIFQDARSGRRSGILTPRFGLTELVRNSPLYRRTVDNIGYYFALTDYVDVSASLDWRSSANATDQDPGWTRWNTDLRYRWLNRFASGRLGASVHQLSNGTSNTQLAWSHSQDFSMRSHLNTNLNFATSTSVQRQTALAPIAALATIASQANFQRDLGWMQMSLGGTRRQYPGRKQVDQDFPSLSLTSKPVSIGEHVTWTPGFNVATSTSSHIDGQGDFAKRFVVRPDGTLDSVTVDRGTHSTSIGFNSPFKVFDFQIMASLRASDRGNDYPELRTVVDPVDTAKKSVRVYEKTWLSQVDWDLSMNLPQFFGGTWNVSPSITMSNIGPGAFAVRTERTGKNWVTQGKRFSYALSAAPTFYAQYPGLGIFQALRHSVQTSLSYSYSPAADISAEYLAALGQTKTGFLGSLAQNRLSLSIQQTFEVKLKPASDSVAPGSERKIKLLSLSLSPMVWDFERAKGPGTGKSKFANDRFDLGFRSDLLPGFDAGVSYSLFQGSVLSDSAVFSPYLESIRAGFSVSGGSGGGLGGFFGRFFGGPEIPVDSSARQQPGQPTGGGYSGSAGRSIRSGATDIQRVKGLDAQISFSLSQQRPPVGANVVEYDPTLQCAPYKNLNPLTYDACVRNALATPPTDVNATQTTSGGTFFRVPPQMNVDLRTGFSLTPNWAATWSTNYDFQRSAFGLQSVNLSRDMHDWRAVFGFTQAPNGAFTFTFFVSLKSEPDIKFDYNRATYGNQAGTIPR